jgi:hypothetical protein
MPGAILGSIRDLRIVRGHGEDELRIGLRQCRVSCISGADALSTAGARRVSNEAMAAGCSGGSLVVFESARTLDQDHAHPDITDADVLHCSG